jgi:GDP-D-mannose dehydratase
MNKKVNMIIGTGVLGAYLSSFLLNKNEKVIVTSRSLIKKISNYEALKIKNKIKFVKLNVNNKKQIEKLI